MKKIILAVVLLAAAGGAVYLFSQRNRSIEPPLVSSYKESIIGDWKIDSITSTKDSGSIGLLLLSLDSNLTNYTFRFDDATITQLLNDSIMQGKARYEWKDNSQFVIIEGDSTNDQEHMQVLTLTPEQLQLRSADSAMIYLKKKK